MVVIASALSASFAASRDRQWPPNVSRSTRRYGFKKPWRDGTHAVVLEPLDLIGRLSAIVPPPRWHLIRYHGLFAGNASERAEVVPKKQLARSVQLPLLADAKPLKKPSAEPSRHPWAWLIMRVFAADVSTCERAGCGGRMRIVQIATKQRDIAQQGFDFDA